ncbi:M14 family zinc carboxypeptidase [Halostella sp. PRR32]|uniref:M14 family zinc carboxypeptidase n=1 Tax=Halostella sp. PRR32 TaxID=3098147 RepID=UPI002B1D4781|nr:M14 family zinc carboxypeptidase [Halostella sp. PRR32]
MDRDPPRPPFDSLDRRAFLGATATSAALSLVPSTAASETAADESAVAADEPTISNSLAYAYEVAGENTTIPTLIELDDVSALATVTEVDAAFRTLTDGPVAAHADLSPGDIDEIRTVDGVKSMRYVRGSNPFWVLGEYPDGIFPAASDSRDFISYDQAVDGLDLLEHRNSDRLRVRTVGRSPGVDDELDAQVRARPVRIAELTNGVRDGDSFPDRETIAFVCSIHGDERSGAEAALRLIEDVLAGDDDDLGRLLDDVALLFLFPNPDGWVTRSPWSNLQSGADPFDTFMRQTGTGVDPNRQYPTVGYVDPQHHPAEPNGIDLRDDGDGTGGITDAGSASAGTHPGRDRLAVDRDVTEEYLETVPDSLSVAERLRAYDLSYFVDLHGMYGSEAFVKGLVMNGEQSPAELADLRALNERVDDVLSESIGPLIEERRDTLEDVAAGARGPSTVPERAYEYGTIADTIDYTTTGGLSTWAGHPLEMGGLDATTISFEMTFDNRLNRVITYHPEIVDLQVAAYRRVIESTARHAVSSPDRAVRGNDTTTGYVTSPSLVRRSADLPHETAGEMTTERDGATASGSKAAETELVERRETASLDSGDAETLAFDLPSAARSVSVDISATGGSAPAARLVGPEGDVVRFADSTASLAGERWVVSDPSGGEWAVRLATGDEDPGGATRVRATGVVTDGSPPDPEQALGYRQRPYEATPFEFFEVYESVLDGGETTALTPDNVRDGALVDGGDPAVDSLVVIHDDAADESYVDALGSYVDAGGTLLVTDAGTRLLGGLDIAAVDGISSDDVTTLTNPLSLVGWKYDDHPLLDGVRDVQQELWTSPSLGYAVEGQVPLHGVSADAVEEAGGTVAAEHGSTATVGSLGDGAIHFVGSLLPPATQENLHPFGVHDYAVTTLGTTLLANAVGHDPPWADGS